MSTPLSSSTLENIVAAFEIDQDPIREPGHNPHEKPEVEPDKLPPEEPGIQPQTDPGKEGDDDDDDDDDDPYTDTEIGDDPDEIKKRTTIMTL
jgi:hypothetical protein